jgi:hypothetical protein
MLNDATDGFTRPRSVGGWDSKLEIAMVVGVAEGALANQAKSPRSLAVLLRKAGAAAQISQIENEVLDRISGILKGRGDGKPLPVLEE